MIETLREANVAWFYVTCSSWVLQRGCTGCRQTRWPGNVCPLGDAAQPPGVEELEELAASISSSHGVTKY